MAQDSVIFDPSSDIRRVVRDILCQQTVVRDNLFQQTDSAAASRPRAARQSAHPPKPPDACDEE